MSIFRIIGWSLPLFAAGAGALAFASYRLAMHEAEDAWKRIAAQNRLAPVPFDPAMVADAPEIARRYFGHSIAPGTPLRGTVQLEMQGRFLLGDKAKHQVYDMRARQILSPPDQFVWLPEMKSGLMRIAGSDALVRDTAWTKFWMMSLVPVASETTSPDLLRSAVFRSAMEGIWAPASLLPTRDVVWEQVGPDTARIRFKGSRPAIILEMRLGPDGGVREIVGQRWSNANPQKVFRLQPFGGTIKAERSFEGYTIPSLVHVGNHYGTDDYLPFFQAEIVSARYQ